MLLFENESVTLLSKVAPNINNNATTKTQQIAANSSQVVAEQVAAVWVLQLLTNLTATDSTNSVTNSFAGVLAKMLSENPVFVAEIANNIPLASTYGNFAHLNNAVEIIKNNCNIFFLLVTGIFIYYMQSGFALMEVGMVRTKNVANSICKNVSYSFVSALGFWLFGMALSFGKGSAEQGFAGSTFFAFNDMPTTTDGHQRVDLMFFFFEYVFCTTSGAIMTGAIAERAQIACYIIYTFITASFTYPILVHWAWADDGWLKQGSLYNLNGKDVRIGYEDFAGSGVVHSCGGVAALIAVIFLGPRIGRFTPDGKVNEISGHSVTLVAVGAMTLFTGFLAFNSGSELAISNGSDAEPVNRAAVNTIISSMGGFICVATYNRLVRKRWLVIPMLCGGLAGCVAICCSCHTVQAWAAFCIGVIAGLAFTLISWALLKLKIDDAADAVGVHLGGGFIGCIALAFFKINVGILYAWNVQSGTILAWQLLGFLVIVLWSASHTYVIFYVLKMFNMVRVDPETELIGLDYGHGHETPYPSKAYYPTVVSNYANNEQQVLEKMLEMEKAKYRTDYLNKPGWSHPVLGGVVLDLSWISVVRSRRKELDRDEVFIKNVDQHVIDNSNSTSQPVDVVELPASFADFEMSNHIATVDADNSNNNKKRRHHRLFGDWVKSALFQPSPPASRAAKQSQNGVTSNNIDSDGHHQSALEYHQNNDFSQINYSFTAV